MGIFVSVILFNAGRLQQYEHKQASFARPTYACTAGHSKSVLRTRLRFPFQRITRFYSEIRSKHSVSCFKNDVED